MMKKIVVGILAHVDAGKTTLSESMLYLSGKIRKIGRVDNKDAFLDTYTLEKSRGITIFSKQAVLEFGETMVSLLDTPGHVDFSAEMERTLQVLDYAILVISGADGIQGHTKTLWRLLEIYQIPVFIFVNKMDQNGTDSLRLMEELRQQLSEGCIHFGSKGRSADISHLTNEGFYDAIAMRDESLLESYIENGSIEDEAISRAIRERNIFPCYFGSALKLVGIESFMEGLKTFTMMERKSDVFGAKIYKISRDDQGNRLTHLKITSGKLKVKDLLKTDSWEEKINQIRVYSGAKYEAFPELTSGSICAVTGLTSSKPGEGLGNEPSSCDPILEPVLSYALVLPEGIDPRMMMPKLRQIEEEEPELQFTWDEVHQEIYVQIMGEVQIEILQSILIERFDVAVTFGIGRIVYKESLLDIVEGVGHFEPLRHYAEVHVLLEPGEPGSGVVVDSRCSEDELAINWQRLIITHLLEKTHRGVLTGSAITDIKITLVAGRAHNRHTEGGDFREATYRAVRQGLMEATSVLLEPYYTFQLELPEKMVGRAMIDIEKMHGTCELKHTNGDIATLIGAAPVSTMVNYQKEVIAYTKGHGRLFTQFKGYEPCHNSDDVIQSIGYIAESDVENSSSSVFCSHGTGYIVPWDQVKEQMHVERYLKSAKELSFVSDNTLISPSSKTSAHMSLEEIDAIIQSTYYSNPGKKTTWNQTKARTGKTARESYYESSRFVAKAREDLEEYLLVDGYNILFAWEELGALAKENLEAARAKLLDALSNYQGIRKGRIIVVFDAYRVEGRREEMQMFHNIFVVFTSEAQTADLYIEKFAHQNKQKYHITVATSDGLQQMIIRGAGCDLLSARELKEVMDTANQQSMLKHMSERDNTKPEIADTLTDAQKKLLNVYIK